MDFFQDKDPWIRGVISFFFMESLAQKGAIDFAVNGQVLHVLHCISSAAAHRPTSLEVVEH